MNGYKMEHLALKGTVGSEVTSGLQKIFQLNTEERLGHSVIGTTCDRKYYGCFKFIEFKQEITVRKNSPVQNAENQVLKKRKNAA